MAALAILFWLSLIFILYTYIGYPLLIAILARFRVHRYHPCTTELSVTVLITAYNEETVIAKKIENTLRLQYPVKLLQIIVAADGSSDRTSDIVRQFGDRIELSYIPLRQGKMAAINRAMSLVRGDIVVFSDANNIYESDALKKLVAPFLDPLVGATTGAKLIIQDGGNLSGAEGFYWKYESWIKKNQTRLDTCTSSVGEMLAVRREYYNPPPNNIINDDYYIVIDLIRRGFKVFYVPDARSLEYISASERDEITRRARISTGHYQAMFMAMQLLPFRRPLAVWHIISHKFCRALVPFAFIGIFLSNFLFVFYLEKTRSSMFLLSHTVAQIILAGQLTFYVLAVIGNFVRFPGIPGRLVYLCAYLVNSNYALLRGFLGYVTKKQTNIWQRVRRGNV
jgi:poly-beta-1,6-N-acetyl-D-glucosamine synthase